MRCLATALLWDKQPLLSRRGRIPWFHPSNYKPAVVPALAPSHPINIQKIGGQARPRWMAPPSHCNPLRPPSPHPSDLVALNATLCMSYMQQTVGSRRCPRCCQWRWRGHTQAHPAPRAAHTKLLIAVSHSARRCGDNLVRLSFRNTANRQAHPAHPAAPIT